MKLLNNDAEVHEGNDYIEIHPRYSYDVKPVIRFLERRVLNWWEGGWLATRGPPRITMTNT